MSERPRTISQIVAELELLSEVAASSHDAERVHGGEPNRAPKGPKLSIADEFRRSYLRAHGSTAQEQVRKDAEDALYLAKHSKRAAHVPGTEEWRHAIAEAVGTADEVSLLFGCSRAHVYKMREQAQRRLKAS